MCCKEEERRLYIKMDVLHHSVLLDIFISPVQGSVHEGKKEFIILWNVSQVVWDPDPKHFFYYYY